MGGDFTLNVLNLSLLTGGAANSGLLELNLGRGGASMNFGTGGANVSIDNIASVMQGAQTWGVNNQIRNHAANNNFDVQVAMRSLHGFGDATQQQLLRDILSGEVEIRVGAEGIHIAETVLEDGRRVIHITNVGYRPGMSVEEQIRLGAILGHEAYRDGFRVGEADTSGNVITQSQQDQEFRYASIGRIMMGDRIQQEYTWFHHANSLLQFESMLFQHGIATGDMALLENFWSFAFDNSRDYFKPLISGVIGAGFGFAFEVGSQGRANFAEGNNFFDDLDWARIGTHATTGALAGFMGLGLGAQAKRVSGVLFSPSDAARAANTITSAAGTTVIVATIRSIIRSSAGRPASTCLECCFGR